MSLIFDMRESREREQGIAAAVAALHRGELVGMPTETVYGLAADATNPTAVAGIFAAKGRPRFNPLIVHVPSLAEAEALAAFSPAAGQLARKFWPGPLTLVLPMRNSSPIADLVTAGLDSVAIRVPAHPVAEALLVAAGRPLAAPSANLSGHVSPTTAAHVVADLGDKIAVILDAGPTEVGLESTVLGWEEGKPVLLRPGGVAREAIELALGVSLTSAGSEARPLAPGMLASHYAPAAKLRLGVTEPLPGEALLAFGPVPPTVSTSVVVRNLSESGDLVEAAANLFAALRYLDSRTRAIAVMPIPDRGLGEAINDRLRRAAAPK